MILIFLIGFVLVIWGLWPLFVALFNVPYQKCDISRISSKIDAELESRKYVHVHVYWVTVEYDYNVNDQKYTSNKVGFSDGLKFQSQEKAEKYSKKIKGLKSCYCSKRNPDVAVLFKSLSAGDGDSTYAKIFGGLLLIGVSIFLNTYAPV